MKKLIALALLAMLTFSIKAQVSTPFNGGAATDYVGWDNLQNFPLLIQHQGNQPIAFLTDGQLRMGLLA